MFADTITVNMTVGKQRAGFTIVELLIVIVVIGILAALVIATFSSAQGRARNAKRASDITAIRKALELYRADKGVYPPNSPIGANVPPGYTLAYGTASYSYSVATDDSWLRHLREAGYMKEVPKDPLNDSTHYYVYFSDIDRGPCVGPVYMLAAYGWEGSASPTPEESKTLNCSTPTSTAQWTETTNNAIFSNIPR